MSHQSERDQFQQKANTYAEENNILDWTGHCVKSTYWIPGVMWAYDQLQPEIERLNRELRSANINNVMLERQRDEARLQVSIAGTAISNLRAEISELTGEDE